MSKREMTMSRFEEIKRQLSLNIPVLLISQNLKCGERTVRQIRDGLAASPDAPKEHSWPAWCNEIVWETVLKEVLQGHPIKFIWSERAESKVGYKAFWEQFHKKYPHYRKATSVHREFAPGERCEIDYAGEKASWVSVITGEIHEMEVFVAILGNSQLIFAEATDNQQSANFLSSQTRMFSAFGGVPKMTVPDCLKQGVTRTHLYDPNINKSYQSLAEHYQTAVVPARPGKPKDKALVEGAVKLISRLYRWRTRGAMPCSRMEVNRVLTDCMRIINEKPHSRFKVSRLSSWSETERCFLMPLPEEPFEYCEWKNATVHPDCHINTDCAFYSAPHVYRGQRLRVKLTDRSVEIFSELKRVAIHIRDRSRKGVYTTDLTHLPDNARAYLESTPQNVLSQSKFISPELFEFIDDLFKENALAHLRRSQGFIRESRSAIKRLGHAAGSLAIAHAIETMKRFNRRRVPYFKELLLAYRLAGCAPTSESKIQRKPNNPMLRHAGGGAKLKIVNQTKQEDLSHNGNSSNT
jgi:transposase